MRKNGAAILAILALAATPACVAATGAEDTAQSTEGLSLSNVPSAPTSTVAHSGLLPLPKVSPNLLVADNSFAGATLSNPGTTPPSNVFWQTLTTVTGQASVITPNAPPTQAAFQDPWSIRVQLAAPAAWFSVEVYQRALPAVLPECLGINGTPYVRIWNAQGGQIVDAWQAPTLEVDDADGGVTVSWEAPSGDPIDHVDLGAALNGFAGGGGCPWGAAFANLAWGS